MEHDDAGLSFRTPDKLERSMAVEIIPGHIEIVLRAKLVRGRWMVRTLSNLHRLTPDAFVRVLAWPVPGIGFVGNVIADVA